MPATFPHVPAAADALFDTYAGITINDPGSAAYLATDPERCDGKFFGKPVQDEILNLISLALLGGTALKVRNETGGTLAVGTLVTISGYNTANSRFLIVKADADNPALLPQYVIKTAILTGANGLAYSFADILNVDTSTASAVGSKVYMSQTAGTYAFDTPPTGADVYQHEVGVVITKHATTGSIRFYPGARTLIKIGTSYLQAQSVTDAKRAPHTVTAKVANYPLTATDCHATFTNFGAAGSVTFTLPAGAAGLTYRIIRTAAFAVIISGGTIVYGDQSGTSLTLDGSGAAILEYDAGSATWVVYSISGGYTIA